jgi:hypothetical protein
MKRNTTFGLIVTRRPTPRIGPREKVTVTIKRGASFLFFKGIEGRFRVFGNRRQPRKLLFC